MAAPISVTAGTIAEGRTAIIATLAFQKFSKAGAGGSAKKFTSVAIAKIGESGESATFSNL